MKLALLAALVVMVQAASDELGIADRVSTALRGSTSSSCLPQGTLCKNKWAWDCCKACCAGDCDKTGSEIAPAACL
jgi:hypothetical protein